MNTQQEIALLVEALDHIMRTALRSRTQTRRLRWIAERARYALIGDDDWKKIDLPRHSSSRNTIINQSKKIRCLKKKLKALEKHND